MENRSKIKIIVAAHKACEVPSDPMYFPLHVGAEGKMDAQGKPLDIGFVKDNTGENISSLNPTFCELTGLYWAWKNLDADYIGLVHYRRYFTGAHVNNSDVVGSAISYAELFPLLGSHEAFVPKKRRYYIETLKSHYEHTHDAQHLKLCRNILQQKYPAYVRAYDKVLKRRWGYMFNMMILKKDLLDDYCSWLFDVLFELYKEVDNTQMSAFEKRYCGRVSEILFNVWLEEKIQTRALHREGIKEMNFIEDVVWNQKIRGFLAAKFLRHRYGQSAASRKPGGAVSSRPEFILVYAAISPASCADNIISFTAFEAYSRKAVA